MSVNKRRKLANPECKLETIFNSIQFYSLLKDNTRDSLIDALTLAKSVNMALDTSKPCAAWSRELNHDELKKEEEYPSFLEAWLGLVSERSFHGTWLNRLEQHDTVNGLFDVLMATGSRPLLTKWRDPIRRGIKVKSTISFIECLIRNLPNINDRPTESKTSTLYESMLYERSSDCDYQLNVCCALVSAAGMEKRYDLLNDRILDRQIFPLQLAIHKGLIYTVRCMLQQLPQIELDVWTPIEAWQPNPRWVNARDWLHGIFVLNEDSSTKNEDTRLSLVSHFTLLLDVAEQWMIQYRQDRTKLVRQILTNITNQFPLELLPIIHQFGECPSSSSSSSSSSHHAPSQN